MELLVLNTNFEALTVVDDYESFIWTDRYNSYGDFELYMAMDWNLLSVIRLDYYLYCRDSEHCMIIENIQIKTDEEGGHLIVSGRSLETILERRIIWGYKLLYGNLQDVFQQIFNENIIAPTDSNRAIANFIFERSSDPYIEGLLFSNEYTGDDLYTIVQTTCKLFNIGFKITLNDSNQFVFSFYKGVDRSYRQTENPYVVFSPKFDNLLSSDYQASNANYRNVALVGGAGEGVARVFIPAGEQYIGLDRRELFVDSDSATISSEDGLDGINDYISQLETKGLEAIQEHSISDSFDAEIDPNQLFKYGEDYFTGDIVQIEDEYGNESVSWIAELIISDSREGYSMYPTFKKLGEEEIE